MAQAEFYDTGQSDFTGCFACSLKVNYWERQDNPRDEHKRLSSSCLYLRMVDYGESDHDEKSCEDSNKITFGKSATSHSSGQSVTGFCFSNNIPGQIMELHFADCA